MPTYRSKEIVDARQFTGRPQSAKELVDWYKAHDESYLSSDLRLSEERLGFDVSKPDVVVSHPRVLTIWNKYYPIEIPPNHWLVLKQDGEFRVLNDDGFKRKYDQV